MTKRMEQSRRHGQHDPRFRDRVLTLVPQPLPPAPDDAPRDTDVIVPVLKLLPQPAPLGTEERVQL
jgi:hypothetical protein